MAIKQQLSAVGLYLAIILICYGQKNVLNEETYKANKAYLEEKKEIRRWTQNWLTGLSHPQKKAHKHY